MSSAAKKINKSDFTSPSGDKAAGGREAPSSKGFHPSYETREGGGHSASDTHPSEVSNGEWTHYLGNPSDIKDRQYPDQGAAGYHDSVNIAYPANEPEAELFMVPNFQEQSGQGANQSTLRPIGSV